MKNALAMLVKLAEVDAALDGLTISKDEIPQKNQELEAAIAKLERETSHMRGEQARLEKYNLESTEFIREKKEWIPARELMVKSLKTNKEYQAAVKEVTQAKKEIGDRELQVELNLTKIESLKQNADGAVSANQEKTDELKAVIAKNTEILAGLDSQIAELLRSRDGLVKEMDAAALTRYNHIRKRVTPAVSKVDNRICSECSTMVPPQLYNQIHAAKEIFPCPRCRRILYVEATLM